MTIIGSKIVRCSICGSETECKRLKSTNAFGSRDLDTRPPEMQRSTMPAWVQRCSSCGYCSSDIGTPLSDAEQIVNRNEYKEQLLNSKYPKLANSFYCDALIHRELGNLIDAAWSFLRAAWVCDDALEIDSAKMCRETASDILEDAIQQGQNSGQEGFYNAVLTDLYRRSGKIDNAQVLVSENQDLIRDDIIGKILGYQSYLFDNKDISCHTLDDALAYAEKKRTLV